MTPCLCYGLLEGHEMHFQPLETGFCGKLLTLDAGGTITDVRGFVWLPRLRVSQPMRWEMQGSMAEGVINAQQESAV